MLYLLCNYEQYGTSLLRWDRTTVERTTPKNSFTGTKSNNPPSLEHAS